MLTVETPATNWLVPEFKVTIPVLICLAPLAAWLKPVPTCLTNLIIVVA